MRLEAVASRYARSVSLIASGVELDRVGDPPSARLNVAIRRIVLLAREDGSDLWDDVLGSARVVRWRLLTQPLPVKFGVAVQAAADVATEVDRLRRSVHDEAQNALLELAAAAEATAAADPVVGGVLLESIQEATAEACVVIAASEAAAAGLESWLGPLGFRTRTASQLIRNQLFTEFGYAVGPPRFFPAALVTAPVTETLNFIFPAWVGDRSLPRSLFAEYAEGAISFASKEFHIGDATEPVGPASARAVDEIELLPQASWHTPNGSREPEADEVAARRVLLSGGYSMWLDDDGEWIRTVDPSSPDGGRVVNIDIEEVRPGVYLLLRDGHTERSALYEAALGLMGSQAEVIAAAQAEWKGALRARFVQFGRAVVVRELAQAGVKTLERVEAWVDPLLVRPRSDGDFEKLLEWLGLAVQPTFDLATTLRRMRMRASVEVGNQLQRAVAVADMSRLERDGHLRLELPSEGFRGILATRVLSISPFVEVIPHHDARVPMPDRSARWLE
jgi:hypothetical protein